MRSARPSAALRCRESALCTVGWPMREGDQARHPGPLPSAGAMPPAARTTPFVRRACRKLRCIGALRMKPPHIEIAELRDRSARAARKRRDVELPAPRARTGAPALRIATRRGDAISSDAALHRAFHDGSRRNDDFGRAQHMIVQHFELRMLPQPPRIASGHSHHMRHARHLRREVTGDPVGLEIMREDDVERSRPMRARAARVASFVTTGLLSGYMRLRLIYRVGPLHAHRTVAIDGLAAIPILRPHHASDTAPPLPWHW